MCQAHAKYLEEREGKKRGVGGREWGVRGVRGVREKEGEGEGEGEYK